jgi:chromosome segregation ATPase
MLKMEHTCSNSGDDSSDSSGNETGTKENAKRRYELVTKELELERLQKENLSLNDASKQRGEIERRKLMRLKTENLSLSDAVFMSELDAFVLKEEIRGLKLSQTELAKEHALELKTVVSEHLNDARQERRHLNDARQQRDELDQRVKVLELDLLNKDKEHTRAMSALNEEFIALTKWKAELVDQSRRQLNDSKRHKDELDQRIKSLEPELTRVKNEAGKLCNSLDAYKKEINALNKENLSLSDALFGSELDAFALKEETRGLKLSQAELAKEHALELSTVVAEHAMNYARQQRDELDQRVMSLELELMQVKNEAGDTRDSLDACKKERDSFHERVLALTRREAIDVDSGSTVSIHLEPKKALFSTRMHEKASGNAMAALAAAGESIKIKQELLDQTAAGKQKAEAELDDVKNCVVCMASLRRVLFLPCSHLAVCEVCSSILTECPVARCHIDERIAAILS